ncbi:T9SS type A sorting domain-containing protein [Pontibacter arcticus]|nr:hypothetical protein [Pontibacter arcticus]
MKQTYRLALLLGFPLIVFGFSANAQTKPLPASSLEQMLAAAAADTTTYRETLSGIHLKPIKKGNFILDFSQVLKENAMLAITNTAGKLVYQKPVKVSKKQQSWRYNLGKLKPDIYLVEVKTSDTTYWTKFKIGR